MSVLNPRSSHREPTFLDERNFARVTAKAADLDIALAQCGVAHPAIVEARRTIQAITRGLNVELLRT